MVRDLIIVQSGGPTAVINASLSGVLAAAHKVGTYCNLLGARHSYEGLAAGRFVELTALANDPPRLGQLSHTPGSWLGSSRKPADLPAIAAMIAARDHPTDLILIGGNGTSSVGKQLAQTLGEPTRLVVIPKTVDNDLHGVAYAPGFPSAAQFIARTAQDIGRDHLSMATFDQVTLLETMGRDTGWLALAASAYRKGGDPDNDTDAPPHLTLVPEVPLDEAALFNRIAQVRDKHGFAVVALNEALRLPDGRLYGHDAIAGPRDDLGRPVFSLSTGTGAFLADRIRVQLGLQTRVVRPGTLGRAAGFSVSKRDRAQAEHMGKTAIEVVAEQSGSGQLLGCDENGEVQPIGLDRLDCSPRRVTSQCYDSDRLAPTASFLRGLVTWLDPSASYIDPI